MEKQLQALPLRLVAPTLKPGPPPPPPLAERDERLMAQERGSTALQMDMADLKTALRGAEMERQDLQVRGRRWGAVACTWFWPGLSRRARRAARQAQLPPHPPTLPHTRHGCLAPLSCSATWRLRVPRRRRYRRACASWRRRWRRARGGCARWRMIWRRRARRMWQTRVGSGPSRGGKGGERGL
jgi:hypothetical protein